MDVDKIIKFEVRNIYEKIIVFYYEKSICYFF